MQNPKDERPSVLARKLAPARQDVDLREILGLRHLRMVTIDADIKAEETKAASRRRI